MCLARLCYPGDATLGSSCTGQHFRRLRLLFRSCVSKGNDGVRAPRQLRTAKSFVSLIKWRHGLLFLCDTTELRARRIILFIICLMVNIKRRSVFCYIYMCVCVCFRFFSRIFKKEKRIFIRLFDTWTPVTNLLSNY